LRFLEGLNPEEMNSFLEFICLPNLKKLEINALPVHNFKCDNLENLKLVAQNMVHYPIPF
jgi:hypothetical protein